MVYCSVETAPNWETSSNPEVNADPLHPRFSNKSFSLLVQLHALDIYHCIQLTLFIACACVLVPPSVSAWLLKVADATRSGDSAIGVGGQLDGAVGAV